MRIRERLHTSATHQAGNDPACPVCNPLIEVIRDLERCAAQNMKDAHNNSYGPDYLYARAVAYEQRRMIKILKGLLK